ncbi:MAG: cob(I)yrinic acid a,c-diamide adenosyltransferase [Turicibacter sp.]|nr:cob(I)yrinic acid a,c-diamide adenosyltransferase [Turicibacter sp.]
MKIYTRGGDKGKTQLIGCKEVHKHSQRIEAYGTLDEVNSFIGLALANGLSTEAMMDELHRIQHLLFDCGTDLATPPEAMTEGRVQQQHVDWLEERIDHYTSVLPPLQSFILPGGSTGAAHLHVARTVARRAEREVMRLSATEAVYPDTMSFINRLSDYLFVAARFINLEDGKEEYVYQSQK